MKHTPTAPDVPTTSHIFHRSKNSHFRGLRQIVRGRERSDFASALLSESQYQPPGVSARLNFLKLRIGRHPNAKRDGVLI